MEITREIASAGHIEIYKKDSATKKAVNQYNEHLLECRNTLRQMEQIRNGSYLLNLILILSLSVTCIETVFANSILAIIILGIITATLAYSFIKQKILYIYLTPLLILLDNRFKILIIANLILLVIYLIKELPLRKHPGYPYFKKIFIDYLD